MSQSPEFRYIFEESYRIEPYPSPWLTRENYPWEYDKVIQECLYYVTCIYRHTPQTEREWFQKQANIFQNRADYIRQEWARQEQAKQATHETTQLATHETTQLATHEITQLATHEATQEATPPSPPAPPAPQQQCTQPSTQPVAQQAEPSENTTENTVKNTAKHTTENTTENTMEKSSTSRATSTKTTGLLSTISHSIIKPFCGETPLHAGPSNAPLLIDQHALLLAFQFAFQLASLPGYIDHAEEMEATGQG